MIVLFEGWDINGAWVGHEKSLNFAKYCKQHMLIAISSQ